MALSQLAINKGKAKEKPYMLSDGSGLHLQIDTSGSKFWRVLRRKSQHDVAWTLPCGVAQGRPREAR
jgi:hypothetical protein